MSAARQGSLFKLTFGLMDTEDLLIPQPSTVTFMTRSDLVAELAARFDQLTHRDVESAVNVILGAMIDTLLRGQRIEIRGFGSFAVRQRPARIGRNPRSGESVSVPPKRVPHFKVGKQLRERIDQSAPKART